MGGWKICLTNAPKFPVAVPEQRGENEDLWRIGTSTIFVSYSFAGRAATRKKSSYCVFTSRSSLERGEYIEMLN